MVMTTAERMKRYRQRMRGEDVPKLKSGPARGTKRELAAEASTASEVTLAALSNASLPAVRVEASAASSPSVVTMTEAEVERHLTPAPPEQAFVGVEPATPSREWMPYGELWQRYQVKRGWLDKLVAGGVVPTRSGVAGQEYKLDVVLAEMTKV